jgi:hypothetical protein
MLYVGHMSKLEIGLIAQYISSLVNAKDQKGCDLFLGMS